MIITIGFTDGVQEIYPSERIIQTEPGITVLDEGLSTTGIFYPFHRISYLRVDNE